MEVNGNKKDYYKSTVNGNIGHHIKQDEFSRKTIKLVRAEYFNHTGENDELSEEEIDSLKRYKDKGVVAFLMARGYKLRGWEIAEETIANNKKRQMTYFCFDGNGVTRRSIVEYYALDDSIELNVNARKFEEAKQIVNSIIQNRP